MKKQLVIKYNFEKNGQSLQDILKKSLNSYIIYNLSTNKTDNLNPFSMEE